MENNCVESKIITYDGKEFVCSLAFALYLIGDKYKALILYHLKDGKMRSGVLQKSISGISNRMFTFSIRALEKDGLVQRKVYPEVPPKVMYELTAAGKSIIPIILQLNDWGKGFAKEQDLYNIIDKG
ncbi:transcriptional regulator [Puteibacter caeruleilacunae]|nr:transcriptional regulator [Puteibacter caeruleilacunae]